jgi:regulator of sigma E protease
MEAGPIVAVQANSPADRAGIRAGDVLVSMDGQPIGNPFTLDDRLQRRIGEEVPLTVQRDGKEVGLNVVPRQPEQIAGPYNFNYPMGVEEIGVAFPVLNQVIAVEPVSPAEMAGLSAGDRILQVELVPDENHASTQGNKEEAAEVSTEPILLDAEHRNWPAVHTAMQSLPPGTKLKLTFERDSKIKTAELEPQASSEYFTAERGLNLRYYEYEKHYASSFGEAMWLGYRESKERLLEVVTVLWKLLSGQLSVTNLAGPGMIAYVAGAEASQGLGNLLIFLTFLSVNLAVINSLPIPVLDGGHFFFLALEGIRGKPVSEKWIMRLTFAGLIFLLSLMVFVTTLDIGRLAEAFF